MNEDCAFHFWARFQDDVVISRIVYSPSQRSGEVTLQVLKLGSDVFKSSKATIDNHGDESQPSTTVSGYVIQMVVIVSKARRVQQSTRLLTDLPRLCLFCRTRSVRITPPQSRETIDEKSRSKQ